MKPQDFDLTEQRRLMGFTSSYVSVFSALVEDLEDDIRSLAESLPKDMSATATAASKAAMAATPDTHFQLHKAAEVAHMKAGAAHHAVLKKLPAGHPSFGHHEAMVRQHEKLADLHRDKAPNVPAKVRVAT
jgi:hypothetical protein